MDSAKARSAVIAVAAAGVITSLAGCATMPGNDPMAKSPAHRAVITAANKHDVPVHVALAFATVESGMRCNATSHAGARGVMQVMPGTARKHGVNPAKLHNCDTGAMAGVLELRECLERTDGNIARAAICYNAGPGALNWRSLPRETQHYITKIKRQLGTR